MNMEGVAVINKTKNICMDRLKNFGVLTYIKKICVEFFEKNEGGK